MSIDGSRVQQWEIQQWYAIGQASTHQELKAIAEGFSHPRLVEERILAEAGQGVGEVLPLPQEKTLFKDLLYYSHTTSVEGRTLRSEADLLKAIRNRAVQCQLGEGGVLSVVQQGFEEALRTLTERAKQPVTLCNALEIVQLNAAIERYIYRARQGPFKPFLRSNVPLWQGVLRLQKTVALVGKIGKGDGAALSEWMALQLDAIKGASKKEELLWVAKTLSTREGSLAHRMAERMVTMVRSPGSIHSDPLLYANKDCFESYALQHEASLLVRIGERAHLCKTSAEEVLTPLQQSFSLAMEYLIMSKQQGQACRTQALNEVVKNYMRRFQHIQPCA